jgi:hypothetical protein
MPSTLTVTPLLITPLPTAFPTRVRSLYPLRAFETMSAELDVILMHVAPPPRFAVLQGLHDGVVTGMKVRGSVSHW